MVIVRMTKEDVEKLSKAFPSRPSPERIAEYRRKRIEEKKNSTN